MLKAEAKYVNIRTLLWPVMMQVRESKRLGIPGICKACEAPIPYEKWHAVTVVAVNEEEEKGYLHMC